MLLDDSLSYADDSLYTYTHASLSSSDDNPWVACVARSASTHSRRPTASAPTRPTKWTSSRRVSGGNWTAIGRDGRRGRGGKGELHGGGACGVASVM
mmetsp:Transcript_27915/g.82011  ORF Transcript_27915/g.82011 Transcript_27915/m.82011 type:complete len:97 (+) Transcript_27915:1009-1299(+)